LQLFGGRGGSSGIKAGGGIDVETFADGLYNSRTKKRLDEMYSFLRSDLKQEKETGVWDEEMSYWVIDKRGNEYFFNYDSNNAATRKEFKKNDIAYISIQSPDGRDDSMGFTDVKDSHRRISDDDDYSERYDSEVNRLFGTRWGKKHPR